MKLRDVVISFARSFRHAGETPCALSENRIRLSVGKGGCVGLPACENFRERFFARMVGKYIRGSDEAPQARHTPAVIDLRKYCKESYFALAKKTHKGNALRDSKKSDKAGFVSKQFVWSNFVPDIVEINQSKRLRSGGIMKAAYMRSVEELGGAPTDMVPLRDPDCLLHHTYCWGIFQPQPGYRQGSVTVNEKLLGYIKFKRNGNYAVYTLILGHGQYLRFGIMYRLHFAIMEWYFENKGGFLAGLNFIIYGAIDSGSEGLKQWKKRTLFEGIDLVVD